MSIRVEVVDNNEGFRFRMVSGQKKTGWAGYAQQCYLDGYVAATQYFLPSHLALTPIPANRFLELVSVI